jgi:hypothetical protein
MIRRHSFWCQPLTLVLMTFASLSLVLATWEPLFCQEAELTEAELAEAEPAGARIEGTGEESEVEAERPRFETETLRGKIVWMSEALERRFGIQSVPEAAELLLALEAQGGRLHPLVEDTRGRAFRRDPRLRNLKDCELFVRRFHDSPMVQVIRLYEHSGGERYELDYWCEICAIAMFELKACDCCQGDIELRRRAR